MDKDKTAREVLDGMRRLSEERLAPLRGIYPSKPLSVIEREALANVIDDVRVLWTMIDWLHVQLGSVAAEAAPGVLLLEVLVRGSDQGLSPEELWDAFVREQTQNLVGESQTDIRPIGEDVFWQ